MTVHIDTAGKPRTKDRAPIGRAAALGTAAFFALHGLAHLAGIRDIWGIGADVTNTTTCLAGLDPHATAYAALGGVWLAAAMLFVIAAAGLVLRRSWWPSVAFVAAGVSLALCILWAEAAAAGLAVDVVILAGLTVRTVVRRNGRAR